MRKFIIMVLVLGGLAYGMSKFNPTKEDYEAFIDKTTKETTDNSEGVDKVVNLTAGTAYAIAVKNSGVRKDYFIYSTYEADVLGKKVKYFGMLNSITLTADK